MNIQDKFFTYISSSSVLTEELVQKYKNSLIVNGDEKQIFIPVLHSYVGVGTTAYNALYTYALETGNRINNYDTHLNSNVVTSIFGQKQGAVETSDHLIFNSNNGNYDTTDQAENYATKLNRDIVVRGLHKNAADIPNASNLATLATQSGVNVTVSRSGNWMQGTDENGLAFTYWDGTTYLNIDDSRTWAYVGSEIQTVSQLALTYAKNEANRVYKNILGLSGDEYLYVAEELTQYITVDSGTITLAPNTYVRAFKDAAHAAFAGQEFNLNKNVNESIGISSYFEYYPVKLENNVLYATIGGNDYSILTLDANGAIVSTDNNNGNGEDTNITNIKTYLYKGVQYGFIDNKSIDFNDSSLTVTTGEYYSDGIIVRENDGTNDYIRPIFYTQVDQSGTGMSIQDGINTIKEIAYILDVITDGDQDSSISLAYSIAQNGTEIEKLKKAITATNEGLVSSVATSTNNSDYLTLSHYSESVNQGQDDASRGNVTIFGDLNIAETTVGTVTIGGENITARIPSYLNHNTGGDFAINQYRFVSIPDTFNLNYALKCASVTSGKITIDATSSDQVNVINNYITQNSTGSAKLIIVEKDDDKYSETINPSDIFQITLSSGFSNSQIDFGGLAANDINALSNAITNTDKDVYLYFPYEQYTNYYSNGVVKALTDVEWVTSYVALAAKEIAKSTEGVNSDVEQFVHDTLSGINAYASGINEDFSALAAAGRSTNTFVDYTYQVGTYLHQHFKTIPTNSAETIIYNKAISDFVEISDAQALALASAGYSIYFANGNIVNDVNSAVDNPSSQRPFKILLTTATASSHTATNNYLDPTTSYFTKVGDNYIPRYTSDYVGNVAYYTIDNSQLSNSHYIETSYVALADGSTNTLITTYVTYLQNATATNTGLADAYNVKRTIEDMFTWIDLSSGKPYEG